MLPKTAFASDAEYLAYLRDWFAGQALTGLLSGQYRESSRDNCSEMPAEAWNIADAMLSARGGEQ